MKENNVDHTLLKQVQGVLDKGFTEYQISQLVLDEVSQGERQAAYHVVEGWKCVEQYLGFVENGTLTSSHPAPLDSLLTKKPEPLTEADWEQWKKALARFRGALSTPTADQSVGPELEWGEVNRQANLLGSVLEQCKKQFKRQLRLKYKVTLYPSPWRPVGIIAAFLLAAYVSLALYSGSWLPFQWFNPRLGSLVVRAVKQQYGALQVNRSVDGNRLSIAGHHFETGFGTHSNSKIEVTWKGDYKVLKGLCGVDDEMKEKGTVIFKIQDGDRVLFESPVMRGRNPAIPFEVEVSGLSELTLIVSDADKRIDFDHADWVDLRLE